MSLLTDPNQGPPLCRKYISLADAAVERSREGSEEERQRRFIFCKLEYFLALMKADMQAMFDIVCYKIQRRFF